MDTLSRRTSSRVALLTLLLLSSIGLSQQLPKPEIASAEGKLAPDFTLKDQNGRPFRLSAMRGHRVLLVFYRGYW